MQSEKDCAAKRHQIDEYVHCPHVDCAVAGGDVFNLLHQVMEGARAVFARFCLFMCLLLKYCATVHTL
jgi:hypothetical protein